MEDGQVAYIGTVPTAWKISTTQIFVKYTGYGNAAWLFVRQITYSFDIA